MVPEQTADLSHMTLDELNALVRAMMAGGDPADASDRAFLKAVANEIAERQRRQGSHDAG